MVENGKNSKKKLVENGKNSKKNWWKTAKTAKKIGGKCKSAIFAVKINEYGEKRNIV